MNSLHLPSSTAAKFNEYLRRVKRIKWLRPGRAFSKDAAAELAREAVESFGLKADVEFCPLKTAEDWEDAQCVGFALNWHAATERARASPRDAVVGTNLEEVYEDVFDAAWDAARSSVLAVAMRVAPFATSEARWSFEQDVVRDVARGACELLASSVKSYSK